MRFALAVIVLGGLAGCDGSNTMAPKHTVGDRMRLTSESWACDAEARDDLDRQHDRKAFGELMQRFYEAKRCLPLQPGTVVDVIGMALIKGRTEVRVKGRPDSRWMMSSVLDLYSEPAGSWRAAAR